MKRRSAVRSFASIPLVVAALWTPPGDARAALTAKANHDHIEIDFRYHGSSVSVRGEADAGVDLVVKITSPEGEQVLKKKGKVGGLLWMNVGSLTFRKAPNLYEVFSTRPLEEILAPGARAARVAGYDALAEHVEIEPAASAEEKATWFREFVAFKESSRLYVQASGVIETKPLPNGRQSYQLETRWPYQAPPGDYTVTVLAVRGGEVTDEAHCKVHVEQVGVVKALASMARDRSALYAIVSIGVAVSAGFGVGMVLRKGGGAH